MEHLRVCLLPNLKALSHLSSVCRRTNLQRITASLHENEKEKTNKQKKEEAVTLNNTVKG